MQLLSAVIIMVISIVTIYTFCTRGHFIEILKSVLLGGGISNMSSFHNQSGFDGYHNMDAVYSLKKNQETSTKPELSRIRFFFLN